MLEEGAKTSFQYAKWNISCKNRVLKIIAIYHPPYSMRNPVTNNIFIDELTDWLTDTLALDKHVLVMGDFKIHINKDNNEIANIFLSSIMAMGLQRSYSFPTHKEGYCLDLNFAASIGDIMVTAYRQIAYISDHQMVAGNINIPEDDVTRKEITYRELKLINYTDLTDERHLDSPLLENLEYNDLVRKSEGNMKEALNIIAPEITKTITVRHQNSWFTEELRKQKKIVRRRETIYKKYGHHHQWLALRGERTKYK